jgi:C-terminal processing protease CtpA/Prc
MLYGWQRIKSGPGKEEFSPWSALRIYPRSGKRFDGQLILLCNRNSYSAANLFAQMMKALPHARLVGDQSGGGGGIPAFGELPNGWLYRFSATQTITPEGEHTEGGIPVDMRVDMDPMDEAAGIDSIIEAALQLFRNS